MSTPPKFQGTISYDLSNSPDRTAVSLREGSRYICELLEGDTWTVFNGFVVIANPARPLRLVRVADANEQELTFAPAPKD